MKPKRPLQKITSEQMAQLRGVLFKEDKLMLILDSYSTMNNFVAVEMKVNENRLFAVVGPGSVQWNN